ncbi:MAG: 50S ribosomal protein L11 [Nitrososphaerales archaeon]|nr:50S ribosomal protein L11 [Nitrososphaerales archaeon]
MLKNLGMRINMGDEKIIPLLVAGGQANAGPPLGPALAPLGLNVMAIVNDINEKTKEYSGMRVPVKIIVQVSKKTFEVEVGIPTSSALLAKALGVEKGSGTPNSEKVGNLNMDQLVKIANTKIDQSYATTIQSAVKELLGTCVSMGITVENKEPKDLFAEINDGKWDESFN